jgi:hypothetical protein
MATVIESYSALFTATLRVFDLADGDLAVDVAFIDPSSPTPESLGTYTVAPSGRQTAAVPPGTYRLEFHQPSASPTGSSCTITVKDGGLYTFIAVPGAIAVSQAGDVPGTAADLFVPTSPLCRT